MGKVKTARRLAGNKAVRRVAFIVVRRQVKNRGRKYVKVAIVGVVVAAVVGGYLATRGDGSPEQAWPGPPRPDPA